MVLSLFEKLLILFWSFYHSGVQCLNYINNNLSALTFFQVLLLMFQFSVSMKVLKVMIKTVL